MSIPQTMLEKKRKYTEKQQSFLDAMYDSKTGDVRQAMTVAGYDSSAPSTFLLQSLSSELIEIATHTLAKNAPRAANKIVDIMTSDMPIPQVNQKLQAAQTLLDRVGVVKEQKMNVEHNVSGGIFIIPAKEEMTIDAETAEIVE
ncbi:MAG: hypothetical protein HOM18_09225 [Candidatus Marinimicrobia bacterium]|nr:hypothetical protein [Candidatus Neomarinimicrobiota bacterium]